MVKMCWPVRWPAEAHRHLAPHLSGVQGKSVFSLEPTYAGVIETSRLPNNPLYNILFKTQASLLYRFLYSILYFQVQFLHFNAM